MKYNVYTSIPVIVQVEANDEEEAILKAEDLQDSVYIAVGGKDTSDITINDLCWADAEVEKIG